LFVRPCFVCKDSAIDTWMNIVTCINAFVNYEDALMISTFVDTIYNFEKKYSS